MTQEEDPERRDPPAPPLQLGVFEKTVAAALIVGFVVFVVVLVNLRSDPSWDRLVFLFAGYEALVFAAAGAFFGTRIQRSTTRLAQENAAAATERAEDAQQQVKEERDATAQARAAAEAAQEQERQARDETVKHAVAAEAGRSLAAAIEGEVAPDVTAAEGGRRGAREGAGGPPATDPAVLRIATLARRLFPDA